MKKYIAEVLGTLALTLVVGLSLAGTFPVSTPVLAGLTLVLFAYSIGHLSGAHINPAVTIAAWSIKKIKTDEAIGYLIAQFLGAALALAIVSGTVGMPALTVSNDWMVGLAELIGMFFFAFGIAALLYGHVSRDHSGLVAGGSLLLGAAIAALMGSTGLVNPAVALGVNSFNLMYILGPIVGAVLGMQAYKYLRD